MSVLLEAVDLVKHFGTGKSLFGSGKVVRAVDGVSLAVREGETFAIVGESGCGKSTLARLLMRLIEPTSGEVIFDGKAAGSDLRALRRDMQFIFQDPFSSLNPRMTVGKLVAEPLEIHAPELSRAERQDKVATLLRQVGLRPEHGTRYPHEFSGGQRQRIGIARALASGPKLLIGDEPVSALDVSVQAQVINLLADLRRDMGLTLVIIAHDLGVIRHMSDRVAVMYLGRIVEIGTAEGIFARPRHPYTQALLASIPSAATRSGSRGPTVLGEMPSPSAPPPGCRFHTRCPHARPDCAIRVPKLAEADGPDHTVACHYWREIAPATPPAPEAPRTPAAKSRFALYRAAAEGGRVIHRTDPTAETPRGQSAPIHPTERTTQ